MTRARTVVLATIALVLSTQIVAGRDHAHYRDFRLGGSLATVAALSGAAASDARTIHEHPVRMQDLEWRSTYFSSASATSRADPVQRIVFSFYDDQLFRLVVDYDRERTAGWTDGQMLDAVVVIYGPALRSGAKRSRASRVEPRPGTALGLWITADSTVALYRASYGAGFTLVVASPRLSALARTAGAQADRLEGRDGPEPGPVNSTRAP